MKLVIVLFFLTVVAVCVTADGGDDKGKPEASTQAAFDEMNDDQENPPKSSKKINS